MSEIKICANKTCKESSHNSNLQFFGFPKSLKTFRLWLERSGRKDLLRKLPQTYNESLFLCEKHFSKFQILKNGKKRLPFDAKPLEFGKIYNGHIPRFRTRKGNSPIKPATKNTTKSLLKSQTVVPNTPKTATDLNKTVDIPTTSRKKLIIQLSAKNALITKKSLNVDRKKKEFNVDTFKDVEPDEIAEYQKLFPKLENIADGRVHCTSCNSHIGTAPINEAIIKMHPVLRVIQCKKCYTFYTSGEFERGEDGSEFYCRWCGQGGEVYCCSKCPKVYCRRCIERNLPIGKVDEIQNNENWICFACDPACMLLLKAEYWALLNFIEKQKKEITNKSLTETELNEAMSKDCTNCCPNAKKRMYGKRKLPISTDSSPLVKRNDIEILPPTIINEALAKKAENKKKTRVTEEIKLQCSPDIGSILCSDNSPPNTPSNITSLPQKRLLKPLKITPITNTIQSVPPASNVAPQNMLLDVHTALPTKNPVFHTINGFRVDLNSAAQQETYRLPNGKLIQVRKQQPTLPATVSKVQTSTLPPPMVTNSQTMVPPTLSFAKLTPPTPVAPILRPPPLVVIPNPRAVLLNRSVSRGRGRGRSRPQMLTQLRGNYPPPSVPTGPLLQLNRNQNVSDTNRSQLLPPPPPAGNEIHITSLSQTTRKRKKAANPIAVPLNSPVVKAKAEFQIRVENSMEVCQHIIGKMKTLTTSTAFKSVKTLTDVKDLTIHLSYLLTYAVGRFKTMQEKCGSDMKIMGFDPECSKSDDDDIEILEPNTTLIDLDSDENDADNLELTKESSAKDSLNDVNMETNIAESDKNVAESEATLVEHNIEEMNQNGEVISDVPDENELSTSQPDANNKMPIEEAGVANGYDIVEIQETDNVDLNKKKPSGNEVEKSKDIEIDESTNEVSQKQDGENFEKSTEETDKTGDENPPKVNENKIPDVTKSIEITVAPSSLSQDKGTIETVTKVVSEIESDSNTTSLSAKNDVSDDNNTKTIGIETSKLEEVVETTKTFPNKENIPSISDQNKLAVPIDKSIFPNESIIQQDNETEQLQKLLEENDEIESPEIENLSVELTEKLSQKKRTTSEITINVSNVESIDEDIFENLIEEINEVGDTTNDGSLASEINENTENSVNDDENITHQNFEKMKSSYESEATDDDCFAPDTAENSLNGDDCEKPKDQSENVHSMVQGDDLSETEVIVQDENDLDLSLSSEIILDPEIDKVDEEDKVLEYLEDEMVDNYENVSETSNSVTEESVEENHRIVS